MENDEFLTKFHGILLSLSNRGLLHKLPDINEVEEIQGNEIEELLKYISNIPSSAKCKIAYYMILNSELKVSDDLKNDELIGWFVNITPAIPLKALIKWIDILHLYDEFCRAIENSQSALCEELIGAVMENQSFCNVNTYLTIWCSVFKKICKSERTNSSDLSVKLIYYFKIISQKTEECLTLINVNYENLCLLERFLEIVLELVTYYRNPGLDDEMYKLGLELKTADSVKVSKEDCIDCLVNTISSVINSLNFDKWNKLNSFAKWKTVRILSSKLLNNIKQVKILDDNLVNILSKLALKESVLAIESFISDAMTGQKCDWTRNIINPVTTECIASPLHEMNDEDLNELLHIAFKHLDASGEEMKELFLAALALSHNQYKWLEIVFAEYRPNLLVTSNTDKDLVETFNRILHNESIPLRVIVPLCMQSPVETIKKLFKLILSSKNASLQVFHDLKPACQVLLPTGVSLLNHVIMCLLSEELTSAEENRCCHLVVELRKNNLVDGTLLENVIKKLKEFLEHDEMNKAVLCLSVMDSILFEIEPSKKFALLVFISQVLGYFSWDLGTFSTVKANGREAVCSIAQKLMMQLDCDTHYKILNLIRKEILNCWEVNQACFCDLWFKFGKIWHGSGKFDSLILALIHSSSFCQELKEFLYTLGPPDEIRTSIILALTKVLPLLTINLWSKAWSELTDIWAEMNVSASKCEVFEMFLSTWYFLTLQLNKEKDITACYKYCTTGFIRLFSFAPLKGESLLRACEKVLFIMKSIEDVEIRKSCFVVLLPVLKDRLESTSEKAHLE